MTRRNRCLSALRLCRLEDRLVPTAGMLDPTFSGDGKATLAFPAPTDDKPSQIVVDNLDRVIVAGYASGHTALVRYSTNGALDTSFGIGGKVIIPSASPIVAVDSVGRIIVASPSGNYDFAVMRLTSAGAPDVSFAGGDWVTFDFATEDDTPAAVTVDSLDRVVVAGYCFNGSPYVAAVARLTSNGALDTSFDGDGQVTIDFAWNATSVAVDSQDRIVVAGPSLDSNDIAVARLTATGALDTSFDCDGKTTIGTGMSWDSVPALALDSLDRVAVTVLSPSASAFHLVAARLTAAGALDASFDGDGKAIIASYVSSDTVTSVTVDSFDRVVVSAGSAINGYNSDFLVERLTADGALDASFDGFGMTMIDFGAQDGARSVAVDSLDRVLVAGYSGPDATFISAGDFAVARLTTTGDLDSTFDGDGRVVTDVTVSWVTATAFATDCQGRLLVAGGLFWGPNWWHVARFDPDGTLDPTFGVGGIAPIDFDNDTYRVAAIAVDSLDRIVVAGTSGIAWAGGYEDFYFAVARLTSAGESDSGFNGDGRVFIELGAAGSAAGVAVDTQNRIIVSGTKYECGAYQAVIRLTEEGELDMTFDGDGVVTMPSSTLPSSLHSGAQGVAVDSQDRVVICGQDDNGQYVVTRLTAAGTLDTTFGGDGQVDTGFFWGTNSTGDIVVDTLDRVVIGTLAYTSGPSIGVARLTVSGDFDTSFDGDGQATIPFTASYSPDRIPIAVDAQGRVVVFIPDSANGLIARFSSSGALDPSFDSDGLTTIDSAFVLPPNDLALDQACRVIVVGMSWGYGFEFAVARLTGDTTTAVVQVNDGSAQRSMITLFKVTFSAPVTFPSGINAAFQLLRSGPGGPTGLVNLNLAPSGNIVTITFDDLTYAPGIAKSLIDGKYILTLVADKIQSASGFLDGDLDGTAGGDFVLNLHRLFGDADGNGTVNSIDFATFRTYFGLGASIFDFDGDGQTNSSDFAEFRKRFGITLGP